MRNLIREGKTHMILTQMQMGGSHGMMTMDACLAELHLQRVISYDMGFSRAVDAKEYQRLVETGGVAVNPTAAGGPAAAASQPRPQERPQARQGPITPGRSGRGT